MAMHSSTEEKEVAEQSPMQSTPQTVSEFSITEKPYIIERINDECSCRFCVHHKWAVIQKIRKIYFLHTEIGLKWPHAPHNYLHIWEARRDDPPCLLDWKVLRPAPWGAVKNSPGLKLPLPKSIKKLGINSANNSVVEIPPPWAGPENTTTVILNDFNIEEE